MPKCFMIRRPLTVCIQRHGKKTLFPDMKPPPVWLDEDHSQEKKTLNEPCKDSSLDNKAISAEVAKKTSSTYSPSVTKVSATAKQPQKKVHSETSATFSQKSVQLPPITTASVIQTQHFPPVSPGTDAMPTQESLGVPCVITASGFGAKSTQETIAISRVSKAPTAQSQYSSQVHLGSSATCTQESDTLPSATPTPNILQHTLQVHTAADTSSTQEIAVHPRVAEANTKPQYSSQIHLNASDSSRDESASRSHVIPQIITQPQYSLHKYTNAVSMSSNGKAALPSGEASANSLPRVSSNIYSNAGMAATQKVVSLSNVKAKTYIQPSFSSFVEDDVSTDKLVTTPFVIAGANIWPRHSSPEVPDDVGARAKYMHNLAAGPNVQPQFYSQRQQSVGAVSSIESMTWPRTTSNAPPWYSSPFFSGAASTYKPPAKTGGKRTSNLCPYYTPEIYSNACASSMNTPVSLARHAEAESNQDWYPSQIPSRVGATSSTEPLNFTWLTAASHTQNRYFSDIHSGADVPVCVGSVLFPPSASAENIQPRSSLHTHPETGVTSINELFTFPYGADSENFQTQWTGQAQSIAAPKSSNEFSGLPKSQLRRSSHAHSDSGPASSNESRSHAHATARAEITNAQPQCFSCINSNSCGTSSNEWSSLSCSTKEDCAQLPYPQQTKPSIDVASTHEPVRPTCVTEDRVVNSVLGSESYAVNTYIQPETQPERIPSSPHAQKKRFVCCNGNKPFVEMNCPFGNPSVRLSSQDPGLRKDTPYMNRLENQIKGKLVGPEDLYADPWLLYHCQSVSDSEPHSMDHEHILKRPIEVLYNLETFFTHEIQVQNFSRSESVSSLMEGNVVSKSKIKSDKLNSGRSFICNKCDAKFDNKSDLDNHSETHKLVLSSTSKGYKKKRSPNRPFLSDIYSTEFIMSDLEFHVNGEHEPVPNINSKTRESKQITSDRPFMCKACDAKFYLESQLYTHRELHNQSVIPRDKQSITDRHFVCKTCDANFALQSELDLHIGKHDPVFDPKLTVSEDNQTLLDLPFTCKVCDNKFSLESDLETHSALHKPPACPKSKDKSEMDILSSSFVCKKCDVHLTLKSDLDSHISENELTLDLNSKVKDDSQKISDGFFVCEICNAKFVLKSDLDTHSDLHNLPEPFESKDKGKAISVQAERTNQNISDSSFMCEICNAKFAFKSDLDTHSNLHNLPEPFESKDKGKTISVQGERTNQNISDGSFMCEICNAKFASKSDLDTHSNLHNLPVPFESKDKGKTISVQGKRTNQNISDGSFMCEICNAKFASKSDLDTHSNLHNLPVPFESKDKGNTISVQGERTNQNISDGSFMCEICNAKFASKSDLDTHSNLHNLPVPFESKDKGKTTSVQVERTNQNISGGSFICAICSAKFALKSDLDSHTDLHKTPVSSRTRFKKRKNILSNLSFLSNRSFVCKVCNACFSLQSDLNLHSGEHQAVLDSRLKDKKNDHNSLNCPPVSEVSNTKLRKPSVPRTRAKSKTNTLTSSLECKDCDAKFVLKSDLDVHQSLHKTSEPLESKLKGKNDALTRSFECKVCNACFSLQSDLDLHSGEHESVSDPKSKLGEDNQIISNRPFICTTCNAEFSLKSDLDTHTNTHKPSKPRKSKALKRNRDRPFVCDICDAKFTLSSGLKNHYIVHKNMGSSELGDKRIDDDRAFVCDVCTSRFDTKFELDYHSGLHEPISHCSCSRCGQRFIRKSARNAHLLSRFCEFLESHILKSSNRHRCVTCQRGFSNRSTLVKHVVQHLKGETTRCPVCNTHFFISDEGFSLYAHVRITHPDYLKDPKYE